MASVGIKSTWVIEKYAKGKEGGVEYWAGTGTGAHDFSPKVIDAIRFNRLPDAEKVMHFIFSSQPAYRVIDHGDFYE